MPRCNAVRAKGHGGAEHIDGFQQGKEQVGHVEASANARLIESRLVPSRALMKARCARDPRAITSSSVAATTLHPQNLCRQHTLLYVHVL